MYNNKKYQRYKIQQKTKRNYLVYMMRNELLNWIIQNENNILPVSLFNR